MRKSGYASAASKMVPPLVVDVRQERPAPPSRLSDEGKALWRDLVDSRRAGWFNGSEAALESYCVAVLNCRKLEAALQQGGPGVDARFEKISRLLRSSVQQATMLARGLRLLPISSIDKRQPPDSPQPIPDRRLQAVPADFGGDGEVRDFAALRRHVNERRADIASTVKATEAADGAALVGVN
jgi:hypothetical protein